MTQTHRVIADQALRASRSVAAMILFAFGGVWLTLGVFSTIERPWVELACLAFATLALFAFALRSYRANRVGLAAKAGSPAERRKSRMFNIINAGQWVLIIVMVQVLVHFKLQIWIFASIIFIVGAHFLPLARLFEAPSLYVTGSLMMLLAVGYPLLAPDGPRSASGLFGAGLVLWVSAGWALRPVRGVPVGA